MNDKQFCILWGEALNYADRDSFISDAALSSIWGDAEDAQISADRLRELGRLWDAANMPVRRIRDHLELTQAEFAFPCAPCSAGKKTAPARTARASCCCRSPGCTTDNKTVNREEKIPWMELSRINALAFPMISTATAVATTLAFKPAGAAL